MEWQCTLHSVRTGIDLGDRRLIYVEVKVEDIRCVVVLNLYYEAYIYS